MERVNDPMNEREQQLWKSARKRVSFRRHLFSYFIVNVFFWAIWLLHVAKFGVLGLPWPVWTMLTWGIGLAFSYFDAYHGSRVGSVEKEYEKLKNKENR